MNNFYTIVPGTQITHSTTDVYELYDEPEELTQRVELQADNGGIYLRYTEKGNSRNISEDMSIANKELAVVIAKRILELYGVQ
jgi:hypothetical protein